MLRRKRYKPLKPVPPWKGPKPKLPMGVTLICRVHFRDLQKYLEKIFKIRDYDVQRNTGARASMTPEFDVTGILPDTPNIWQQVDNIRRGRSERNLGLILNLLCKDGFIPAGKYIIVMTPEAAPLDEYRDALHQSGDPSSAECIAIKRANQKDRNFTKQVAMLDRRLIEHKSKLPTMEDSNNGTDT